jgi:glycosidase
MSKKKAESKDELPLSEKVIIYEINTFIWLNELSIKYGKKINLANIPAAEWDEISGNGFSAIWLMGVWERSDAGKVIAKQHSGIMHDLKEALPDLEEDNIAGSPYCIKDYQVDFRLGGAKGLAKARKEMAKRGMRLILDFVPNHVAPDHPWTMAKPEFFITGTAEALLAQPDDYYRAGDHIFAKARDPFYPPWPDVLQLNVFNEGLRDAIVKTLNDIASQCDGIRCDMAMLVMNDIFARTWGEKAGDPPQTEFWPFIVTTVKKKYPAFSFIAESYWDTEAALLEQGFDFCYDKKYYDFIKEGAEKTLNHILEMEPYRQKLLRFLENHDEPRAAALFSTERNKALALASLSLPGAKLLHDGQLEGRTVKVPVFLSRRQEENVNEELKQFYLRLLKILQSEAIVKGKWFLCPVSGWADNQTCRNILAWEWISEQENLLVVINLSELPAQGLVRSSHPYLSGRTYQLFDVLNGELFRRDGDEMNDQGLYVVLKAWGMHTMSIEH